ncbi:MAG: HlyC/CorC family transporter, partial [Fibrobacteria bacterium]|nr:HlyC/CorC family transporter [Fibrobacteria bacterium]
MDPDPLFHITGFIVCLFLSGYFNTVKRTFAFFQRFQGRIEDEKLQDIAKKSIEHLKRDGYTETGILAHVVLDCGSVFLGVSSVTSLLHFFPNLPMQYHGFISITLSLFIVFIVSHQLLPLLGQIFISRLANGMYHSYSFYWLLAGWLGRLVFNLNQFILIKTGFNRRFKIFFENDLSKLSDDEHRINATGLEEEEAEMVQNIFNIGNTQVKEIFTPRVDTIALDMTSSYLEVIKLINSKKYTRIPVYEGNIDKIKGILHVKDLLGLKDENKDEKFSLLEIIRPAFFIPRYKKIDDLMAEFKVEHTHIAVVVDEYGGTAGIITMEDILEEIVGEIQDEDDRELPLISTLNNNTFIIDPIIPLDDFNQELNLDFKPEDDVEIETLGGFIQYLKGSVPKEGDMINSNG